MIAPIQTLNAGEESGDDRNRAAAALEGIDAAPEPLLVGPPLPDPLDLAKAFPPRTNWLREFVEAQAEAIQFDPAAVALLSVGVIAGAAQAAWKVKGEPLEEELPLWTLILAEPGERKSALFQELMRPVYDWEKAEAAKLALALAFHADKREALESRLKAAKSGQKRKTEEPGESLEELRAQLMALPELFAPELTTGQPTPEAVYSILRRNGGKLILAADEMDSGTLLGSRYSEGGAPNMDTLLSCHVGARVKPSRASKEAPAVERACGSLVITTQPRAVEEMFKNPVARDRGLLDRFFACRIVSRMGHRALHPPPCPQALRERWSACLFGLLEQPWKGRVIQSGDELILHDGTPIYLSLSAGASQLMDNFREDVERRLRPDGDLRPISGFGSKLPGGIARLAALLELAGDRRSVRVSAESMEAAISWAPWLIAQTRHVRGHAAESFEHKHARRITETHLPAFGDGAEVAGRDLFNRARTSELDTMEKLRPVLALLVDLGFLIELPPSSHEPGTIGRPASKRYRVRLPRQRAAA